MKKQIASVIDHPTKKLAHEHKFIRINKHLCPQYYVIEEFFDIRKEPQWPRPEFEEVEKIENRSPFIIYFGYTTVDQNRVGTRAADVHASDPPSSSILTRPNSMPRTPVWARAFWLTSEELITQERIKGGYYSQSVLEKCFYNWIVRDDAIWANSIKAKTPANKFDYKQLLTGGVIRSAIRKQRSN